MKVVVVARTDETLEHIRDSIHGDYSDYSIYADLLTTVEGNRVAVVILNEENTSKENFGKKIKELRKKYCRLFRTDQLTMLVPKKEVKYKPEVIE